MPSDLRIPFDPRDVIARIVDGSDFDEFKPLYGVAGDRLGQPVRLSDRHPGQRRGVLFSEESQKATQFIQLANRSDTPLLFLHNTTGYMVGKQYEEGGMIKHGSMMINAVSNSTVPHISLLIGASYGAGHYGMCGRAYDPRFLFAWPSAKSAVMGGAQLAGVLSIVSRAAEARGQQVDEDADAACAPRSRRRSRPSRCRCSVRAALRRRRHRPARHPPCWECACPPSPMARSRGRRTSASSGCEP